MSSFILFLIMIIGLIFYFLNNPLSMGTLIIIQTIFISLIMFLYAWSWFSFILMMAFLSGIMILFSYISALSNNKLYFFKSYKMLLSGFLLTFTMMMVFIEFYTIEDKADNMENTLTSNTYQDLYNMYYNYTEMMTVFLMLYLLVVLIVVTKNVNITKGPLKYK